jgi:hypothetical protein
MMVIHFSTWVSAWRSDVSPRADGGTKGIALELVCGMAATIALKQDIFSPVQRL